MEIEKTKPTIGNYINFDLGLKSPGLRSLGLKSSWLKSPGLKVLGLKLGVEKSWVEMSFNRKIILLMDLHINIRDVRRGEAGECAPPRILAPMLQLIFRPCDIPEHDYAKSSYRSHAEIFRRSINNWSWIFSLFKSIAKS